ncbi:MAG: hypothetical protein J5892_02210 [Bacilli bacterium]|nr:hypothetical protein [Bacilli bacterium]
METPKKNNYFLRIIFIIFIIYTGLYISSLNTTYDRNEVILTEENMRLFEEDIKNNKPLDLKKYQTIKEDDYGNLFSNTGYIIGNTLDTFMLKGINKGIKVFKKLFTNN